MSVDLTPYEVIGDPTPPAEGSPLPIWELHTIVDGPGSIEAPGLSCTSDCTKEYTGPQQLNVYAVPSLTEPAVFDSWEAGSDGVGDGTLRLVVMSEDREVEANFSTQATPYHIDNWPAPGWRPFDSGSPWNTVIDHDTVEIDPNSEEKIARLIEGGPPALSTPNSRKNWGTPLYFARSSDPLYTIITQHLDEDSVAQNGRQVRCPDGAIPSQANDGVMWVIDQESGWINQLQRTVPDHVNRLLSCWKSYRMDMDGSGFPDLVTGAPTGVLAVRPEELAAGYVNHTMSMAVSCLKVGPVAPFDESNTQGHSSRCNNDTVTRLQMGNVIFLDLSHEEIEQLPLEPWQEAFLKGFADFGALVGLNGGTPWDIKFENHHDRLVFGKPNPYTQYNIPEFLNYRNVLDPIGGWQEHLKVRAPFART